jgi:hypothetical protein
MMTLLIPAGLAFLGFGAVLWSKKRNTLKDAMTRNGFKAHEVLKALRLYDRNQHAELIEYCRDVVERNAQPAARDWTKAESYEELAN